jgi:hypothetical protein
VWHRGLPRPRTVAASGQGRDGIGLGRGAGRDVGVGGRGRRDAGGGVRVGLVERLVLEQRLGERVELRAIRAQQRLDVLVRRSDDPAHLVVDQLLRLGRDLGRAGK